MTKENIEKIVEEALKTDSGKDLLAKSLLSGFDKALNIKSQEEIRNLLLYFTGTDVGEYGLSGDFWKL